ncbi:MAG: oligosaccharide flippase family protein [Clostridiales bacterium]|nr:oligosaccharide flippase family protein [Clostridiales bacterium]
MQMNRTKNAARNMIWGAVEKIASLVLPFLTRTVLIKVLGAEYLGLNSLFTSILSVLSISELGIGTAIVFSMYKPIAEYDNDMLCALLNAYKKIYYVIGTIILAAGVIIIPFLPKLIKDSYPADINLYVLYSIYLFNTVVGYYLFAYKAALFSAFQRNDLASKRSAAVSVASNVFQILLLLTTHNYYTYVLVVPLATIITNIANAYLANKMFPKIKCRGSLSKETKHGIKKRIVGLLSFKIYTVVFTSVDTIVISAFLGLTPLTVYDNYYYVQSSIIGFLTIITASVTAGIGNKMVTCSIKENYTDFKNINFINAWLVGWCSVCLFCLYQHFMQWWVGKDLVFPFSTMALMVFYFLLPRITTITYTYREAAGLWWEDRFRPLAATAVNLVFNIILVKLIGMNGALISTLMCTVLINVPWGSAILFKNYFKSSPLPYFGKTLLYIGVTSAAGAVTYAVCGLLPSEGFIYMIIKGVICCIVPNLIFLLVYRKMPEFKYAKQVLFGFLNGFVNKLHGKEK